jgi:hypothetical protein
MITKFLSNKWNLYGVQVLACVLMIIVLNDALTIGNTCIIALCVYLIGSCQRILGVAKGMLVYAIDKEKLIDIVNSARKNAGIEEKDND